MSKLLPLLNKPDKFFYLSIFILGAVFVAPCLFFLNSYNESSKIAETPTPQVLGQTARAANSLADQMPADNNSLLKNQNNYLDLLYSKDFLKLLQSKTIDLNYADQYEILYRSKAEKVADVAAIDIGSGSLVTLSWNKFKEQPERIEIYRSDSPLNLGELIANLPGKKNGYHDLMVKKDEIYYYTITTFNQAGQASLPVKVTAGPIKDLEPPPAPSNIKILPLTDNAGFKITWQNPRSPDLSYINIYRSTKRGVLSDKEINGRPAPLVHLKIDNSDSGEIVLIGEYEDNNTEPDISYYYILTAEDFDGNESLKDLPGPLPTPGNPNLFNPIH